MRRQKSLRLPRKRKQRLSDNAKSHTTNFISRKYSYATCPLCLTCDSSHTTHMTHTTQTTQTSHTTDTTHVIHKTQTTHTTCSIHTSHMTQSTHTSHGIHATNTSHTTHSTYTTHTPPGLAVEEKKKKSVFFNIWQNVKKMKGFPLLVLKKEQMIWDASPSTMTTPEAKICIWGIERNLFPFLRSGCSNCERKILSSRFYK